MTREPSRQNAPDSTPVLSRPIGRSVEGRDIVLHSTRPARTPGGTLLVAGIHGDERATVLLLESFVERALHEVEPGGNVRVVPLLNPDGFERNTRYNARGVDLNRNCETKWTPFSHEPPGPAPWSEPESRALRDLILTERPERIVCLHWALAEIDADGPQSTTLARALWEALSERERAPYRIRVWENDPGAGFSADSCPGSFGQWCGYGLRYPDGSAPAMITLELPYAPNLPRPEVLPEDHLLELRAAWSLNADAYLAAVEGPVQKMLIAACRDSATP